MDDTTFKDVNDKIQKHLKDRDWDNNPPRGIAISIALEAAELLEHFQWSDEPVGNKDAVASEVADILIYIFQIANTYNIDIPRAIEEKLSHAAKKYPAENFKGKTLEERNKAWYQDKLRHKKTGL